jgi:hypothetical protein
MKRDCGMNTIVVAIRAFLMFATATVMTSSAAMALDGAQVNGAKAGMRYREVRARLLEFGYDGGFQASRQTCIAPQNICKAYPKEVETCAGTGVMPCRFVFKYPRGRTVIVVTKGTDLIVSAIMEE